MGTHNNHCLVIINCICYYIKIIMKFLLIFLLLFLTACLGPSLFTVGNLKITASDVITVPHKIQTLTTNEKEK